MKGHKDGLKPLPQQKEGLKPFPQQMEGLNKAIALTDGRS
jgi:hypothetical protein